ncbi:hypothetical protein VTN96DRAFT_5357 [Rasamsonia emersonii]
MYELEKRLREADTNRFQLYSVRLTTATRIGLVCLQFHLTRLSPSLHSSYILVRLPPPLSFSLLINSTYLRQEVLRNTPSARPYFFSFFPQGDWLVQIP